MTTNPLGRVFRATEPALWRARGMKSRALPRPPNPPLPILRSRYGAFKDFDFGIGFTPIPKARTCRLWNRLYADSKEREHFVVGISFKPIPTSTNASALEPALGRFQRAHVSSLESALDRFQRAQMFRLWNRLDRFQRARTFKLWNRL